MVGRNKLNSNTETYRYGQDGNICVTDTSRCVYLWIYYRASRSSLFSEYLYYVPVIKWPGLEVNKSPLSTAISNNQWCYNSTLPIFVQGTNRAKRTLFCVLTYIYLYLYHVYTVNVTWNVQRVIYLITLQIITCVIITFLGLCKSQSVHKFSGPLRIVLSGRSLSNSQLPSPHTYSHTAFPSPFHATSPK
jgi:hypothetical protein